MKNNKKIVLIIVGILAVIAIAVGVSYAYWKSSTSQTSNNILKTTCLKLDLIDVTEAINLEKTYPITDEEAGSLTPYQFKVSNICNTDAEFSINLEVMEDENRLNSEYIALSFNDGTKEILGNKTKVDSIYNGTETIAEAYNLDNDTIVANGEKIYTLKLWMDESSGNDLNTMNKVFLSKITLGVAMDRGELAVDYITSLAATSEEIVDDETEDHNLRYIGADPNNYVSFNGELWRIIGVMNDVADENGTVEPRIKLIRNKSIGRYSWDNKGTVGSNDWSNSAIKEVLNSGAYYNRTSGNCPNGGNGATKTCDFSSTGLTSEARNMISEVKWKIGGIVENYLNELNNSLYKQERGTNVVGGHATEWKGKVALSYPSDYGYATSGGEAANRNSCLETALSKWDGDNIIYCKNNNWLYTSNNYWTLSSYGETNGYSGFYIFSNGRMGGSSTGETYQILPTVYLEKSVRITLGTGSATDPFILSF